MKPKRDSNQNVILLSGSEANGVTRVRVKRPLVAADADDITIGVCLNIIINYLTQSIPFSFLDNLEIILC